MFAGAEEVLVVDVTVAAVLEVVDGANPFLLRTLALNEDGRTLDGPLAVGGLSFLPFVCSSLGRLRGSSLTRDRDAAYEARNNDKLVKKTN